MRVGVEFVQPVRIVNEVANGLSVLLEEVLLGVLQALEDTLANGDAWYNDYELRPAVEAVELEHRLRVDVGLACASLHLNVQLARADIV